MILWNDIDLDKLVAKQHGTADAATDKPHQEQSRVANEFALQKGRFGFVQHGQVSIQCNGHQRHAAD